MMLLDLDGTVSEIHGVLDLLNLYLFNIFVLGKNITLVLDSFSLVPVWAINLNLGIISKHNCIPMIALFLEQIVELHHPYTTKSKGLGNPSFQREYFYVFL